MKIKNFLLALALTLLPTLASAQTATQGLAYTIDATLGGAVITGPGTFNCVGPLVIPNSMGGQPVVAIGANAFQSKTGITTLDLSLATSLVRIGKMAFNMCKLTGDLDLSPLTKLEVIDRDAFYSYEANFRNGQFTGMLTLPEGGALKIIGRGAFQYSGFVNDNIVIPATVTDIGSKSLCALTNVRAVTLKSTGTINLGDSIFYSGFEMLSPKLEYVDMSTCTLGKAITTNGTISGDITNLSRMNSNTPPDGQPFLGTPAHTVIYLPRDNATGDLAAAMAKLVDGTDNMNYVRLDQTGYDQCQWLYVQDGVDYYLPHTFTAAKATWNAAGIGAETTPLGNRAFTKGAVSTAYLPFPFKLPDPTSLRGYALRDKKNTPVEVFRFRQQDPTLEFAANTPYIIRDLVGGSQLPVATNVTVPATPIGRVKYEADQANGAYDGLTAAQNPNSAVTATDPGTGAPWGFYGTAETITNGLASSLGWNAWILNSNVWYSLGTQTITPMRAFLHSTDPTATARPTFELTDIDGSTTGIASIDTEEPANGVETRVYNTSGQYLGKDINALPRGMYIVNGKKVVK